MTISTNKTDKNYSIKIDFYEINPDTDLPEKIDGGYGWYYPNKPIEEQYNFLFHFDRKFPGIPLNGPNPDMHMDSRYLYGDCSHISGQNGELTGGCTGLELDTDLDFDIDGEHEVWCDENKTWLPSDYRGDVADHPYAVKIHDYVVLKEVAEN